MSLRTGLCAIPLIAFVTFACGKNPDQTVDPQGQQGESPAPALEQNPVPQLAAEQAGDASGQASALEQNPLAQVATEQAGDAPSQQGEIPSAGSGANPSPSTRYRASWRCTELARGVLPTASKPKPSAYAC